MTLRTRAITLIAVTVLGGVVLFALSSFAVVRSGYGDLGRAAAADRLEASGGAIEGELVRLRRAAEPLASSVNAVAFARGQPEGDGFLARVGASALERYHVDAIVVLDAMGGVVHQVADDELPASLLTAARQPVLRIPSAMTRTAEGLLVAEPGPVLVLARAITGPLDAQVPAGTLILLRDLGDPDTLGALGLEGVTFTALSDRSFIEAPLTPNRRLSAEQGTAEATYTDPVGRTVLQITASVPTSIRVAEAATLRRLVVLSVALAAGVGLTLLVWFERRLLSRLSRLTDLVGASVGEDRVRVELPGHDELSTLAERIETTLRSLEATERELRSTNAQLEQAAEVKNEFISVVSHELRTPLTAILGFTETLRLRYAEVPEAQARGFLDRMSLQARNLDRMVEELLVLSRMASGRVRHAPELLDLNALADDVVDSLPAGVPVTVQLPETPARVIADPDHLRRIVVNYVENARKYGRPPIEVTVTTVEDHAVLVVRDHGAGVPDDFVPDLFDPFTQASSGTRRTSRGVGLGLSIVRALAEANGGQAWYEAGAPGAAFAVRFPLVGEPGAGRALPPAAGEAGPSPLMPAG